MNTTKRIPNLRLAVFSALAALSFPFTQSTLWAADHGDSPVASNHQQCDIGDVYAFMSPEAGQGDNVILIATVRGFVAAGENGNFGIFDPIVRYRFSLETSGDAKSDKTIEVTFSPRTADPGPAGAETLQGPTAQVATVKFNGFKGDDGKKLKSFTAPVSRPSVTVRGGTPAETVVTDDSNGTGIKAFFGLVDDPFFFDIPAFSGFVGRIRANPANPDLTGIFTRQRDSFAGYNIMSIALSVPKSLFAANDGKLGVEFSTLKPLVQNPSKKTGEIKGTGALKTIDRAGVPAVNVTLIPFTRKNEYNQATTRDDAKLKFAIDILRTLKSYGNMGTGLDSSGNLASLDDVTGTAAVLAGAAVLNGDFLRLDTSVVNSGAGGGDNLVNGSAIGFPNGRRLKDDVVDILLTLILNNDPLDGTVDVKDGVDVVPANYRDTFPFLGAANPPEAMAADVDPTQN